MLQLVINRQRLFGVLFLFIASIALAVSQERSFASPGESANSRKADPRLTPHSQTDSRKAQACVTNRNAPPLGPYHWPADANVTVYFVSNMFTAKQRVTLLDAMKTWTAVSEEVGSGVRFIDAGETERRMTCRGCLTVGRREIYKQDQHHYAFFHLMSQDEGRLLVSAWIDLDFGITNPEALEGFMAHELAHGLGLWDCETCKKKLTLMNAFPGINQNNGLLAPSRCDLEAVRDVYQGERLVVAARFQAASRSDAVRGDSQSALTSTGMDQESLSVFVLSNPDIYGAIWGGIF